MKKMLTIYFAGLLAIGFAGCEKDYAGRLNQQPTYLSNGDQASLQFFNSTLNSARTYVFIDNILASGTATGYAASSLYPGTSPAYMTVTPGSRTITIKDTLLTTTQPSVSVTSNLDAGAKYTVFSYDTLNRAKALIVKDNIVIPADTTSRLRFANMIYSATAIPNMDVFSVRRQQNIFTNVQVNGVTDFIPFFSNSPITDTLHVRATGTTINLATLAGVNPIAKRSYTVIFRGRYLTVGPAGIGRQLVSYLTY
jgi:hypothetical protein